ncbi:MAG: hypothetical protein LBS18_07480 [Clostridiales bacterium]|jgi:hypothetical protein|nr:hypothetical protein [Clostridiales bacterium]
MIEYKSDILKIPYKAFDESIDETQISRIDALANQRAAEGWKLITTAVVAGDDANGCSILVTFGKEK